MDNLYKVDLKVEDGKDPKNEHSKSGHILKPDFVSFPNSHMTKTN